jgi:hypothetical protein
MLKSSSSVPSSDSAMAVATGAAYSKDEAMEKSYSSQQAPDVTPNGTNEDAIQETVCKKVQIETGSSNEIDNDGIPKLSLARLSLILSTLWVCGAFSMNEDARGKF